MNTEIGAEKMNMLFDIKILLLISVAAMLSVSCNRTEPVFKNLSSSKTNINFTNIPKEHKGLSILYYLYYYNGGGVSAGDVNNDGLVDLYFTANNKGGNKLYLNKGNFEFEDITVKAGVAGTADWCTGVTMADVNADGYLDIYVSTVSQKYGLKGHNELFINNGNLTFTENSAKYGLDLSCVTTQTAFFDYDRDGDLDCYVLNQSHHPHANIVDTSNRRKYDSLSGDRLYRNDIKMTGKFTDVSKEAGIYQSDLGYGLGLAIADINNDGWDDIYIGNDFHENDYYYINNGNGTFAESGAKHFRHYSRFSMGNDVADYNNDGQLDVITVDMLPPDEKVLKTYGSDENPDIYKVKLEIRGYQKQYSKNCLQRNNGNGISFSETALMSGVSATDWSWSSLFADFDNDGNKDLFITSGIVKRPVDLDYVKFVSDMEMKKSLHKTDRYDAEVIEAMPDGSSHPYLYKGDGKLKFTDVSNEWGTGKMKGFYCGAAYADLDNDGDLDVAINALNAKAEILQNNSPKKKYLALSFKGDSLNTFGIGAKAYVFSKNNNNEKRMQYQQLMLSRGFESSSTANLHFGLDSVSITDSILIVWPDQRFQVIKNIKTDTLLNITQKNAAGVFNYDVFFKSPPELLENITDAINMDWQHKENDFLDYNVQYLIPHAQSTRGPKIAVADVNKDGLEDFYVCGATAQPGVLMIQSSDGRFIRNELAYSDRIRFTEEVDAVFFDANNDSFPDLYVVSGGNVYEDGNPALPDNLYLNDGKGNFTQAINSMPKISKNKSCVSAGDIDNDGDIDLFVGGLANARAYGKPQPSYLLINDGKGFFSFAAASIAKLDSLGIVTSSAFADINKDGWVDLIVTGEWMPVKIFVNNKGKFTQTDLPVSTGLWQTIYTTDVNRDGFVDILAGNWGFNTKLYGGKNGPVKLYVKDFDKNGSVEQVMCYTIDGKEYTFLAKDELERALPILKKAYLTYGEVAGKTVDYIFYDLFEGYTALKAETLGSACFINDGKGNFSKSDMPDELQMSPVFAFAPLAGENSGSYFAGGNFYNVIPYEGRYDALQPTLFSFDTNKKRFNVQGIISAAEGEIRDAKWINRVGGQKVLIVARNNGELNFYKQPG